MGPESVSFRLMYMPGLRDTLQILKDALAENFNLAGHPSEGAIYLSLLCMGESIAGACTTPPASLRILFLYDLDSADAVSCQHSCYVKA